MPTYEYQCSKCGSVFDIFQSIKASPLKKADCEVCGEKRPVRRLIGTGGAVIFKGSGFYQTDYRSESYKNSAKAETGAKTDAAAGSDSNSTAPAKSDSKSDTKAESKPPKSSESTAPKSTGNSKSSGKSKG